MTKSQITTLVVLAAITLLVSVGAAALISQGTQRMEQVDAYQGSLPTVTCTPTATPIPTWTPTAVVVVASPDPGGEITLYFDLLSPLLEMHWALKTEMAELYAAMRSGQYCSSGSDSVSARSSSIVAAQDQLKYSLAALAPPRSLTRFHERLVSSVAHSERANLFIFKGCIETQDPWWPNADFELQAADAEWEKARGALDDLLTGGDVRLADNPRLELETE